MQASHFSERVMLESYAGLGASPVLEFVAPSTLLLGNEESINVYTIATFMGDPMPLRIRATPCALVGMETPDSPSSVDNPLEKPEALQRGESKVGVEVVSRPMEVETGVRGGNTWDLPDGPEGGGHAASSWQRVSRGGENASDVSGKARDSTADTAKQGGPGNGIGCITDSEMAAEPRGSGEAVASSSSKWDLPDSPVCVGGQRGWQKVVRGSGGMEGEDVVCEVGGSTPGLSHGDLGIFLGGGQQRNLYNS